MDDTIQSVTQVCYQPSVPISTSSRTLNFSIPASQNFLNLNSLELEIDLRIVGPNNEAIQPPHAADPSTNPPTPAWQGCVFEQMIGSMVIASCEIRLQDTLVSTLDANYGVQSFVLMLLGYTKACQKSKLTLWGVALDSDPSSLNFLAPVDGSYKRSMWQQGSGIARYRTPIFSPLTTQQRALLPMCRLDFTFRLNNDKFCLLSAVPNTDFQYEVHGAKLIGEVIQTSAEFQLALEKQLSLKPARYEIENFYTKTYIVPNSIFEFRVSDPFQSSFLPEKAIVFFSSAITPSYATSQVDFPSFHIDDIYFNISGTKRPAVSFQGNLSGRRAFVRAYRALFNSALADEESFLSQDLFGAHYCFFSFNLGQPNFCQTSIRTKNLCNSELVVHFSPTSANPSLRCYILTFAPETLQITAQRTVIKNY